MQDDQPQGDGEQQAGWVFKPDADAPARGALSKDPISSNGGALINWSASEYVSNPKNSAWFMMLAIATIALAAAVYFITKDKISVVVIAMLGIIVGVFAARQPRTLEYALDTVGLHMGEKYYPYSIFKSFSVVQEGAFNHISLLPLKRFMPPLTIHFPPESEEKVINTFADYLPYEEKKPDLVDSFSRRVRF